METTATDEPFFNFDLGERGDLCLFNTVEDLERWLQSERIYWGWLSRSNLKIGRLIEQKLFSPLEEAKNVIAHVRQLKSGVSYDHRGALDSVFERHYCERKSFHSSSREAKFVEGLKDENPEKATYALAYLLGILGFDLGNPVAFSACVEAVLLLKNVSGVADSEALAIEGIKQGFKDSKERLSKELTPLVEESRRLEAELRALSTLHDKELTGLREKQTAHFQESFDKSKEVLRALEQTYDATLSLQKPVRYWHNKARQHAKLAARYTLASLAVGTFTFWMACEAIRFVPDYLKLVTNGKDGSPTYAHIIPVVIVAFLLFWLLRVLVRLLLSNLHLQTDASEKETMIQTYLALLRNPNAVTKDERKFILESVFHRSSTGIVKDDSSPPTLFDLLIRR